MNIVVPELSLVVLIGCSGSGKTTFARKHFKPTEVLSSDYCRGLVSDDENSQDATRDAFDVLRYIAGKRLERGLLTVVDATNVQAESRKPLVTLAREFDVIPVAIVLRPPEAICHERNALRPDRTFGRHVVRNQNIQLRRSLRGLKREGFRHIIVLDSLEAIEAATIERQPLWNNLRHEHGPFDIIGDVHGCYDEVIELLEKLGYDVAEPSRIVTPPGRKAIFLGDLVDRGPKVPQVLKLVISMVQSGSALCVPGNHDIKLMRKLNGKDVQVKHGLAESLEQLANETAEFNGQVAKFIDSLVSHYVLDDGKLVVAHAGMKQQYQGRGSRRVREFALYGETTGETDEFGLPVRQNWASEYRGDATVVYGHTPVPEADWLNRTINIDTGCVFGGKLSALRWPEREIISVAAKRIYSEPARPFLPKPIDASTLRSSQQEHDDLLDLDDVLGKRILHTRLMQSVTVREGNAAAALEVMSRFAANPKWLIYLPPTMSPSETTKQPGLLEHPREAFEYFQSHGVEKVICQEKHMGSRAVVVICRDEATAKKRFGVTEDEYGIIYTRTGRRFFDDRATEVGVLDRIRRALDAAGFWSEFASDWFCLDCELMPWSAKAQDLLKNQYAAVGSAAHGALPPVIETLATTSDRFQPDDANPIHGLLERHRQRQKCAEQYIDAYRRYCWAVRSIEDFRLAPFHLLASEGAVHVDKDHLWHVSTLARLAKTRAAGELLQATNFLVVDLNDSAEVDAGISWWTDLTSRGGEGMVVKSLDFVVRGSRGLVQPAIKCRGQEYLRIIYGPEYTSPTNLDRLRSRSLGGKRSLAFREFTLGIESLERFVHREPLRRVHECVFAVLALESEPVDPRL